MEEIECENAGRLDARDIAKGTDKFLAIFIRVVDDQRATTLTVTTTAQFTLSGAQFAGLGHFDEVGTRSYGVEETEGCGRFGDGRVFEDRGGDHKGDFRYGGDAMTAGLEEGGN